MNLIRNMEFEFAFQQQINWWTYEIQEVIKYTETLGT